MKIQNKADSSNQKKNPNNDKEFHSKNITHDPNNESARAVFGFNDNGESKTDVTNQTLKNLR
ncbi:MAG: CPC_1213 family protein [Bacillota bacterium]|nr:CPC_1213 family protein [Bacillota bacterium]